jgi:hypothetical protein
MGLRGAKKSILKWGWLVIFDFLNTQFGFFIPNLCYIKPDFGYFKPRLGYFKPNFRYLKPKLGYIKPVGKQPGR